MHNINSAVSRTMCIRPVYISIPRIISCLCSFSCSVTCLYLWTIGGKGRRPRSFAVHNGTIKPSSGNKVDGWRPTSQKCDITSSSFARRYVLYYYLMWLCYACVESREEKRIDGGRMRCWYVCLR